MLSSGKKNGKRFQRLTFALSSMLLMGCSSSVPYSMTKVSGDIKYDDNSLIPAGTLLLQFQPTAAPLDAKTHPRVGQTYVDTKSGNFGSVTTYKYADGLINGTHKVVVLPSVNEKTSKLVVPPEYMSAETTPLEVDTTKTPFELRIPKPNRDRKKA